MSYRRVDTFDPDKFKEEKILAQLVPSSPNSAETLFAHPGNHVIVRVTAWTLVNHNNQDVDFEIFFDETGSNYNDSTRVNMGDVVRDGATPAGDLQIPMLSKTSTLGFEASDVDCTMTIWGTITPRI